MLIYFQAKVFHVKFDGRPISPPNGYLIRKGPGVCHFDFAQEIILAPRERQPSKSVSRPESGRKYVQ